MGAPATSEEFSAAVDRIVAEIVRRAEWAGSRALGAHPCAGDHGAAPEPCQHCGAVL